MIGQSDAAVFAELGPPPGFDPARLQGLGQPSSTGQRRVVLGAHQLRRLPGPPEKGRRAAIMVAHLRPLLHAVGGAGPGDLELA